MRFEHHRQPLLPRTLFLRRVALSTTLGLLVLAVSLVLGMLGYRSLEHLAWMDSFLNAAMLLSGMGPLHLPTSDGGKLFAGLYAIYSCLAVIAVAGIAFAPLVHRLLHRFHLEK